MNSQDQIDEDFETIDIQELQIQLIEGKGKKLSYPQLLQLTNDVQISPNKSNNKQQIQLDIHIGDFDIKPSDIDLQNQVDEDTNFYNYEGQTFEDKVARSVHLQSEQFRTRILPLNQYQKSDYKTDSPFQNHNLNIPIEKSLICFKKPKVSASSSTKQQKPKREILHNEQPQKQVSDSSLDFDIPIANKLNTFSKSGSSIDSAGKHSQNIMYVDQYQILLQGKQVLFKTNDKKQFLKDISQPYLDYIWKYFFHNFNLLLPYSIQGALEDNLGRKPYLQIYFDFIVRKYPTQLYNFLQKSNYKEPDAKKEENDSKPYFQSKISQLSNIVVQTIYSAYDTVGEKVKKLKGQTGTKTRILQNLFSKQVQMAQKHFKERIKIQKVINHSIQPSVYEKQQGIMRQKQFYVLMCLKWLIGFEIAIDTIKEKQQKADDVQKQKYQNIINEFLVLKQKEQKDKIIILQEKIKSIYSIN